MALRYYCLTALAVAVPAAFASAPARADEAFLCGPDTVVYVKPSELEERKKTDACIARYFGLTVEKVPAPAPPPAPRQVTVARKTAGPPPKLKGLEAPETAERVGAPPQARTAAAVPPVASPGTDFRNVRVINAVSPEDQWFKHVR